MPRVKVTGYLNVEDDEYDDGPNGPLTEEAWDEYAGALDLEEIEFTEDDSDA